MYHPRLKGCHYDMGWKMGCLFKKNNVRFPINLDAFQTRHGKACAVLLEKYFPEAADEIRGVTDAIGYDHDQFAAWMMCMGSCLNIEGGRCVEARGCTAFSFTRGRKVYSARNNDLPPLLKAVSKSIMYRPQNGFAFVLNTSSFINGEEGINGHGLVAAMTFVLPHVDEIQPGINSVFLVRYVLEKCRTVGDGLRALKELPIASSCNILLTDSGGQMAVAECHPVKMHIRYPEINENGESLILAVNHFTSEEMRRHDASDRHIYFSMERYQNAHEALMNPGGRADGLNHAKDILRGKFGFMCQYDRELNFDTLWSSVFDISGKKIYRAEGNPQKTKFREDARLNALWA